MDAYKKCGAELTASNWYPSLKRINVRVCKGCHNGRNVQRSRQIRRPVKGVDHACGRPSSSARAHGSDPRWASVRDQGACSELGGSGERGARQARRGSAVGQAPHDPDRPASGTPG